MLRRFSLVAGVMALVAALWFFLQRTPERAGNRRPEPSAATENVRGEALAAPATVVPSGGQEAAREASTAAVPAADGPVATFEPLHPLRVRVSDAAGRPCAEIPVRVELASEQHHDIRVHRVTTGADGLAVFPTLEAGQPFEVPDLLVRVLLDGLFEPPVEASLPADPWPTEPIELVLPAAGALVVTVLDEYGEPLASGKRDVELRLARELQAGAKIWRERTQVSAPIEEGSARFPALGVGLACLLSYDDRPDHARVELELAGPVRVGEELRVELRLAPSEGLVALRLLAPDGAPLVSTPVEANLVRRIGGGSFSSGGAHTTDGDGRLVIPVREGWSEGQVRLLSFLHKPAEGPECQAEVDLSRELAPGTSELGDVVLRTRPVLVAGRVLDAEGNGVWASLTVERRYGEGEDDDWGHVAMAESGLDGRFALYEEAPDAPLRLAVDSGEHQPLDPLPFVAGTSGLEIVLVRGLALRGRVLVPEGMSPLAFEVTALGARERDRRSFPVPASGAFELAGLAPGAYDVEFALRPTSERIFVVPAVQVRGAEDDPRLAPVDLRAHARRVRLAVRASDGSPAPGGWVHVLSSGSYEQVAFVIEGGAAEVLVPAAGSDVEVSAPGHRALLLEDLAEDREVRLEPDFRVRCELAPAVPLPEDGALQLRLVSAAEAGRGSTHYSLYRAHEQVGWFSSAFGDDENTFDERRTLDVSVPGPGTYDVVFHLVLGSADGGRISYSLAGGGENAKIVLDERSDGATFVVEPGAEYVERLAGK